MDRSWKKKGDEEGQRKKKKVIGTRIEKVKKNKRNWKRKQRVESRKRGLEWRILMKRKWMAETLNEGKKEM